VEKPSDMAAATSAIPRSGACRSGAERAQTAAVTETDSCSAVARIFSANGRGLVFNMRRRDT
jgi:hypothetical protein